MESARSNKRKKSLTPEVAPKKQSTLLAAFAKIDKAVQKPKAPLIDLSRPTTSGAGPASSIPGPASQPQPQRSTGSQPLKSVSHVSASYVEFNQPSKVATSSFQPSVSHVSDSFKPRSVQASAAISSGLPAGPSADEASSPQLSEEQVGKSCVSLDVAAYAS